MARNSFNKKELRNAARIYAEKRLTALDSVLENQPVILSPIFRQSIASIRHRAEEASLKRQQVRKRVAVVCFIIILLVTAFFSFNETARAEFFNWIKSIYNEYIVYQFLGEKPSDELPDLTPEWLPDGVYMSKTEELENSRLYTFQNSEGDVLILEFGKIHSGSSIFVFDDEECRHLSILIGSYEVDCYISETDESDYIWHDSDGVFFFSLGSLLPHETNVKIIENIKVLK